MRQYYLLGLLCLLCKVVSAQTEKELTKKVEELKGQKLKLIVGCYPHCVGMRSMIETDTCQPQDIRYLFWQDGQHNYVQRFDDCKQYEPLMDKVSDVVDMISLHKTAMLKERIKPPGYRVKSKGKFEEFTVLRDHSCHASFSFYDEKTITKDIDSFFLMPMIDDLVLDNGKLVQRTNLNYQRNRRTYLVKLKELVERKTAQLYPSKN